VKAAIPRRHGSGEFRVLEVLGKCSPILIVRAAKNTKRHQHPLENSANRGKKIAKPVFHQASKAADESSEDRVV
jgi:hypothetical protein